MENWKAIVGYEGWYEVSDLGRIRNIMPGKHRQMWKVLRPFLNRYLYRENSLFRLGTNRRIRVHCEVMKAFVGPCPPGMQVNHRDGNKSNNALSNLEYVTPAENVRHAFAMGLHPKLIERVRLCELSGSGVEVRCAKCGLWKDSCSFRKHKGDSFQSYCKPCANLTNYAYRKSKRESFPHTPLQRESI